MSVNKKYKCRLCKECNGRGCIGQLPRISGIFESANPTHEGLYRGRLRRRHCRYLQRAPGRHVLCLGNRAAGHLRNWLLCGAHHSFHVVPALLRKFHEAKLSGEAVTVWKTSRPLREFLHVDDMAEASVFVMNLPEDVFTRTFLAYPQPCFLNVGTGEDLTIGDLAGLLAEVTGFDGDVRFDASLPDGTPRKVLDVSRLKAQG